MLIICFLTTSVIVTVLLLEGIVRIVAPQNVSVKHSIPAFGLPAILKANHQAKNLFFLSSYTIKTDDKHLRNFKEIDYAKPDNTFRILCLGGSILSAVGVENNETLAFYLDQLLNGRIKGKKFEVINAGSPGWELLEFYTYFKNEGYKFSPDLVIMIKYTGEIQMLDLPNIEFDEMQAEKIPGGRLKVFLKGFDIHLQQNPIAAAIIQAINKIPFYENLSQISHLATLVHNKVHRWETAADDEVAGSQVSLPYFLETLETGKKADWIIENHEYKNFDKNEIKRILYGIALEKFLDLVIQKKAKLIYLNLPAIDHVLDISKFAEAHQDLPPSDPFYPFDLWEGLAQFQKDNPFSLYFPHDIHWTPAGHHLAAILTFNHLVENRLVPLAQDANLLVDLTDPGRIEAVKTSSQRLEQSFAASGYPLFVQGMSYINQEKNEQAKDYLTRYLQYNISQHGKTYFQLALISIKENNFSAALKFLLSGGLAFSKAHNPEEAKDMFRAALTLQPENKVARRMLEQLLHRQ